LVFLDVELGHVHVRIVRIDEGGIRFPGDSYVVKEIKNNLQSWQFKCFGEARIEKFKQGLFELVNVKVARFELELSE